MVLNMKKLCKRHNDLMQISLTLEKYKLQKRLRLWKYINDQQIIHENQLFKLKALSLSDNNKFINHYFKKWLRHYQINKENELKKSILSHISFNIKNKIETFKIGRKFKKWKWEMRAC